MASSSTLDTRRSSQDEPKGSECEKRDYMNSMESMGNKLKINRNKDRGHFLKIPRRGVKLRLKYQTMRYFKM